MREIQVAENKTLKLTNVLARKIDASELGNLGVILTQMQNFIKSHSAMPVGPVIQCVKFTSGPNPEPQIYFMMQVNQLIPRLEPGYEQDAVLRVKGCLYAHFTGPMDHSSLASQKLNIYAYEHEIELTGTAYSIYVNQDSENGVMDVFMETNLSDLQDRRIMMEKKLPAFGYALILLVAFLMVFLVIWSTQNKRTYVSQSTGSVQAANKTYIMSSYSGSITELNISEGSYVTEGDLIAHIKSTDLDIQQDSYQKQLDIYKKQKSQYEKLLKSIQDDKNYFSETDIDDQPYYYQYESYKSQVSQKAFDASPYQAAGYTDEQIKTLMEQNQSEVESLYYSTLQSISANLTSVQANIDNIEAQLDALNTGANDYYIYAPTSGVIHMDTPYKVGMVLSAGSALATVASENSDLEIVAAVTVNDRPLINVGDPCKIAITGLSEYSYGTLTGTVTSIDSDVTASSSGSYYKMTITPDSTYVISNSGDKVDLSNGMSVTARVEYDKLTYFEYAMEALGVLFR